MSYNSNSNNTTTATQINKRHCITYIRYINDEIQVYENLTEKKYLKNKEDEILRRKKNHSHIRIIIAKESSY